MKAPAGALAVITTVEELNELPMGSVIRTGTARVACKSWHWDTPIAHDEWYETGVEDEVQSDDFDDFPHQVLYRGGTETP